MATDPAGKLILIVEDDEQLLGLLTLAVLREGFNLLTAETGEQACEKLKLKPDLVVLDLMLPGLINGLEVLEQIKLLPAKPGVIVVTAYGSRPEYMKATHDLSVSRCLLKPLHFDEVVEAMHQVLKTSRKTQ